MSKGSVEQALRQQVKDEIGDVEDMPFKQKTMLNQKFGIQPALVTLTEIEYWEMREKVGDDYVSRAERFLREVANVR